MKTIQRTIILVAMITTAQVIADVAVYDLSMSLHVPRVYDNTQSLGYRRYQTQRITGRMYVDHSTNAEPTITISNMVNRTHRVGGFPVTYDCEVEGVQWHVIGSNKTGKFKTASVKFSLTADPSYNIGADEPDNTLVVTLAGQGSEKSLSGYVSGQLGCGCMEYGHLSPTRLMWWLDTSADIAATWGTWRAKRVTNKSVK